jgi:phospholipid-transporting ATPase
MSGKHHRNVEHRAVYYNCPGYQVNPAYANNHVTTAKYNVLTFLPKTLFELYRRAANV